MQVTATMASRHEHLVLYDPAAIPSDTPVDHDLESQEPKPISLPIIKALALHGQALVLGIAGGDCEAVARIYVDEEPSGELTAKAQIMLDGAKIEVPSGTIKCDGIEFLSRAGEVRRHSEGEEFSVPPSSYRVTVLSLLSWKSEHRAGVIASGVTARKRLFNVVVSGVAWAGVLMFPLTILVAPAVVFFAFMSWGWLSAAMIGGSVLIFDVLVIAGSWFLAYVERRFPELSRISNQARAFEENNPDLVVLFRRCGVPGESGSPSYVDVADVRG